ncbi:FAD-dependent oxidoreductase [Mangrovicoccus sp. HB161399]|uniref:FAD-dependent oxidoreductase n=1 Tax=Mangrovicoccus sp. HB161399 TaxID=2720392 RepID=UPI0015555DD8|nr:FAD-dependent oxidoreductase [Mangrovicoccus sp. HB161399]
MTPVTRRRFLMQTGSAAAALAAGGIAARRADAARILVLGAGPAGIAAAQALRAADPRLSVTLVERDPARLARSPRPAGPFLPPAPTVDAADLAAQEIGLLVDDVAGVDWQAGRLELFSGRREAFDRLVMAPGTAPAEERIEGHGARARHAWPAAWGSAAEARRLAAQIAAMPDGGRLVLRLPAVLAHDPALVAARAASLAAMLARQHPAANLTVLDATLDGTVRQSFAVRAGDALAGRTDWRGSGEGGTVLWTDADAGEIGTSAGTLHADVVNFLPALGAGTAARLAGLADASLWCPVDAAGRSALREGAVVIGDARKGVLRGTASAAEAGRSAAAAIAA